LDNKALMTINTVVVVVVVVHVTWRISFRIIHVGLRSGSTKEDLCSSGMLRSVDW